MATVVVKCFERAEIAQSWVVLVVIFVRKRGLFDKIIVMRNMCSVVVYPSFGDGCSVNVRKGLLGVWQKSIG